MARSRPNVSDPGRIVAHRGASHVAPENTLAAFREALRQGARWIEFDVSLLGDGTPVIHHDATLERCTNRTGPLSAYGAGDLAGIDAGDGAPLATLEDALVLIGETGLYANLEMKPHDQPAGRQAGTVAAALEGRPWAAERIIVSSFSEEELAAFRQAAPQSPVAMLYKAAPPDWMDVLERLGAAALHLRRDGVTVEVLEEAMRNGIDVRVFTVNDPTLMLPFRDHGLTGVITDHPPLFLEDPDWAAWGEGGAVVQTSA